MRNREEVEHAFTSIGKLDAGGTQRVLRLNVAFKDLAHEIMELAPETPDRTASLRKLLEAKFTAIQAVTHSQPKETKKTESVKKS